MKIKLPRNPWENFAIRKAFNLLNTTLIIYNFVN